MAATGRCCCKGHWRLRLRDWVVTQRKFALVLRDNVRVPVESVYSEIKCRCCQQKWRSSAQYVDKLPDYKERSYGRLHEADLLALIREKRLVPDIYTGEIKKQRRKACRTSAVWLNEWITLKQVPDKKWGHLFVAIKHKGRRRWAAVNRLVWMAGHDRLVPKGFDVDHKDCDRTNNRLSNLDILPATLNRGRGDSDYLYDDDF